MQITLYVPEKDAAKVRRAQVLAKKAGYSISQVFVASIRDWVVTKRKAVAK